MIKKLPLFFSCFLLLIFGAEAQVATTFQWTWVKGDSALPQYAIYGSKEISAATNKPGSRDYGVSWKDTSGNFWLFGGVGNDTTFAGYLNDLWKYTPANNQWVWMNGDSLVNGKAVYGIKGTASSSNMPGARSESVSWTDSSGNLWLFGGYGYI